MFTVAYELRLKPALVGYGIGLAYVIVDFSSGRIEEIAQAGAQSGFYLLAWAGGRALHGHEERRAAAERHVVRVELEREEQARVAVVEERARIARELHDAVAHSVSVMVLQAGGVRRLLGNDPAREREREALAGVEETGRQAVHELHRMLGILRKADPGAELAPSPSLRRVGELVDQVRSAGLETNLTIDRRAGRAAARPGHVGLPDRAGGAHERAALRARLDRRRDRHLRARTSQLEVRDDGARVNGKPPTKGSGPRHRRHARARRALRRRAGSRPGAGRRLPRACEAPHMISRRRRRRPAARARRAEDGARRRGRHRGRRRGRRRRAGARGRAPHAARRRPDGHPHARARRPGGLAAAAGPRGRAQGPRAHDVRRGGVPLRGAARRARAGSC